MFFSQSKSFKMKDCQKKAFIKFFKQNPMFYHLPEKSKHKEWVNFTNELNCMKDDSNNRLEELVTTTSKDWIKVIKNFYLCIYVLPNLYLYLSAFILYIKPYWVKIHFFYKQ